MNGDISIIVDTNIDDVNTKVNTFSKSISSASTRVNQIAKAFSFLDTSVNSGKISVQTYSKLVEELNREEEELYGTLGQVNTQISNQQAVTTRAATGMSSAAVAAEKFAAKQRLAGKQTNKFGMYAQQVGYQVGDFFVQVQSGTNALVAFGQQGTQLAGLLPGLAGAILGIGLSVGTAFGKMRMESSNLTFDFKAMKESIVDALEPISPLFDVMADAVAAVGNVVSDVGSIIANNLSRVVAYVTAAATVITGRLVASFVAARLATISLTTALVALKAVLVRLGFTAIIVAAGELLYQFTLLVKGAGGFGEALTLLKNVAVEVFDRIKSSFGLVPLAIKSGAASMAQFFMEKIAAMGAAFVEFTWSVADGLNGLFNTNLKGADASVFNDLRFAALDMEDAANSASTELDALLSKVTGPIESIDALRAALKAADETGKAIDVSSWFGEEEDDDKKGGSAKSKLTKLQEEIQSIADTIESSMTDAFMSIVEGTTSVSEAFRTMAYDIIAQLYKVLVVQRMVGSWDAETGTGTGLVGSIISAFQADGGVWSKGVQMFANGGVVNSPTMFSHSGGLGVMGEAGPEAIMPLKRGSDGKLGVATNGGSSGPQQVNITYQINGNGDDYIMQKIAQAAPSIAAATESSILDNRRRGGKFKKVFK